MPTFPQLFAMSFMIIQIIYKLNFLPFVLRALLWWGLYCGRKQDLRVVEGWSFLFQVFERAACVNSCVTLKGLRGVENAAVAVKKSSVLAVSGTVLIISSGRVLVFNCSLKVNYLFCNWKYRLALSSSRRSFPESTSSMLPCISYIAGRNGTGERVCRFRYFRSSWGIFSWNPA